MRKDHRGNFRCSGNGGLVCPVELSPKLPAAKGSTAAPFKIVRRDMLI
jgi:hypothetical protein